MILAPTNRRIIRPYDEPSFEHTQRYGLIKGHWANTNRAGLWVFNEGSGDIVLDLSGNGNVGTLQGTAPSWTSGKFRVAVLLPGTDEYITIANEANFDRSGGDMSVVLWLKTSKDYSGTAGFIFSKRLASMPFWYLRFNSNNTIGAQVGTDITHYRTSATSNTYNDGLWHQVVMVFHDTANIIKLYVDGNLDNNPAGEGTVGNYDNNALLEIGSYNTGAGNFFDGLIDHAMFYSRALIASEIVELNWNPFAGIERKAAPVYFFVPIGEVKELTGTIASQSAVSGSIKLTKEITGAITSASTTTGAIDVSKKLTGTIAAASTVSGKLRVSTLGGLSTYAENNLLELITGKTPLAKPTAYIGFCTADPGEGATGADCNEVANTNGYGRVATAGGDWNSASSGAITNAAAITSPCATGGGWGEVTHYVLVDSPTYGEGNVLVHDELDTARVIEEDDMLQFAIGELSLTLD